MKVHEHQLNYVLQRREFQELGSESHDRDMLPRIHLGLRCKAIQISDCRLRPISLRFFRLRESNQSQTYDFCERSQTQLQTSRSVLYLILQRVQHLLRELVKSR